MYQYGIPDASQHRTCAHVLVAVCISAVCSYLVERLRAYNQELKLKVATLEVQIALKTSLAGNLLHGTSDLAFPAGSAAQVGWCMQLPS